MSSLNLLIVESPGKIATITKYLGADKWLVKASVGHFKDLPKKELGIDKNTFKMNYVLSEDKKNVVSELKFALNKVGAENVYLATDEDREGEAISYHLATTLGLPLKSAKRVTFNEITKECITKAINNPRTIDLNLVSAQESRRAIDRLVGYEISPILWKKLGDNFSAGRVQSVALKLVVEREKEILSYTEKSNARFSLLLKTDDNSLLRFTQKEADKNLAKDEATSKLKALSISHFQCTNVVKSEDRKGPKPPFSTSSLQQDAVKKLGFSIDETMKVAQKLYEGGYITYMRTDSVNLSEKAIAEIKNYVENKFGNSYFSKRVFKNKSENAQEAHEAVRPTNFELVTIEGTQKEKDLYSLIYSRALASQMSDAIFDKVVIEAKDSTYSNIWDSKSKVLKFDGYLKAYNDIEIDKDEDEDEEEGGLLNSLPSVGASFFFDKGTCKQVYSHPPKRFNQATIVEYLEKLGIGRPSTYASILNNIISKLYVVEGNMPGTKLNAWVLSIENNSLKETSEKVTIGAAKKSIIPSDNGNLLSDYLCNNFSKIMDYKFTSNIEKDFDLIAEGKSTFINVVSSFSKELDVAITSADNSTADIVKEVKERKTSDLGNYKDKVVRLGKGEKGPYLVWNEKFFPFDDSLFNNISLQNAIEIIENKKEHDKIKKEAAEKDLIKKFGKYEIRKGIYGLYLTDGKDRCSIKEDDLDKYTDSNSCKSKIKSYLEWKSKNSK